MKVAVIGGGPAGLATLKFLQQAHRFFPIPPVEARLFEAEDKIGGTFVLKVYEDAELVSSKYLTAFSDFRLPQDAPDFITPQEYVEYLNKYATAFDLWASIECNSSIKSVQRGLSNQGHLVTVETATGEYQWHCDAVAVCTGLNTSPYNPTIDGIANVPQVMHSSQLKSRAQFGSDTNVLILGAGETAMDLAHLAVTSSIKSVTLCHRDGFFCAPKIIPVPIVAGNSHRTSSVPNKPTDTSIASLFDTAYVHPVLQRSPLLWKYYDKWTKGMHWLISGTAEGPDQWVGQMNPARKYLDSILLCKSDRALPYLNEGHRSESWIDRWRRWLINVPIRKTEGKRIDVQPWPKHIDTAGCVHFSDTKLELTENSERHLKPDILVFATGYVRDFSFLSEHYPDLSHADVRGIYKSDDVSLGFIGFVRPSLGAIPPLAEMQAQLWVLRLLKDKYPDQVPTETSDHALHSYEMDYKLHQRGSYDFFQSKRGVDHESYAYQLALDIGSAPKISYVWSKGWKVFFTWAMGPNFNPKFRLTGPWEWDGAEKIMQGELFNVVQRSGGYVYLFTYSIIPFVLFGGLSVLLYAGSGIVGLMKRVWQAIPSRSNQHQRLGESAEIKVA